MCDAAANQIRECYGTGNETEAAAALERQQAHVDKWLRLLPDARAELFDNDGHMVLDESAAARRAMADVLD
ncbi:MAG: hypothetical protein WD750_07285 [Gammaproteobacteria bacterium]